jgi:peroxiredoxin
MRIYVILIPVFLLLYSCQDSPSNEIKFENIKDSANRTIPTQIVQQVSFYDADKNKISADQFNHLLAKGTYVSKQHTKEDGSEEVSLISIEAHSKTLENTLVPNFQLIDIEGKGFSKKDIEGKVTVLTFWMTSSFACTQELNAMNELAQQYDKNKSFEWLALALDQSADLSRFLRGRKLDFTFVSDQENFAQQLGILAYPTHLIIDKDGIIRRAIVRQPNSQALLQEALEQLL